MAFDPNLPVDGAEIIAVELRGQFTALEAVLGGTACNPNLETLSLSLDDPPVRPQVQAMLDLLHALLNQLTRV